MNLQEAYNLAKRNKKACVNAPDHFGVRNGISYPALITNATLEKDKASIVIEFCIWSAFKGIKKECRFSLKEHAEHYFLDFCEELNVENYKELPGIPLWISFESNDGFRNVRVDDASITIEELKEAIDAQKTGKTSGKKKRASSLNFAENTEQEDFDEDFDPEILQYHIDTVKQRKKSKRRSGTATKGLKRRRAVQRKQEDFEEESEPEDSEDFEEEFESDDFDTEED